MPQLKDEQVKGGCPKCPCPAWRHPGQAVERARKGQGVHLNRRPKETFTQMRERMGLTR